MRNRPYAAVRSFSKRRDLLFQILGLGEQDVRGGTVVPGSRPAASAAAFSPPAMARKSAAAGSMPIAGMRSANSSSFAAALSTQNRSPAEAEIRFEAMHYAP